MRSDRRRVRLLLLAVFVPVLILVGVLASAVAGEYEEDDPLARAPLPGLPQVPPATTLLTPRPAPPPAPARAAEPTTSPEPVAPPPPAPQPAPTPSPDRARDAPPEPPADAPSAAEYVPPGAERIDVGHGAQGAAIFRPEGSGQRPGPVVILLHGWVAIDPHRYGSWIAHLVGRGVTVIYPAYQTRPAYDTISPLAFTIAGVRAALERVALAPGRLVVAGHSAGAALAADYAAVATARALPAPAAVFSVYPGRKLRHLPVPIPAVDLSSIAPATRVVIFSGERDSAVGSTTAREIAAGARQAHVTLTTVVDDAVDDHSAPRRASGAAQRTFWTPLDRLVDETAAPSAGAASQ